LIRLKSIISYDGSKFYGFQKQKIETKTVAGEIEKALNSLNIFVNLAGAGRTDRGVHAVRQVIHFDVPIFWSDIQKLKDALNQKLDSIVFKQISIIDSNFHARFSAKSREYKYCFITKSKTLFLDNYIAKYDEFDIEILKETLKKFEGKHDFALFCKSGSMVSSTTRTITYCNYSIRKGIHIITIRADGFLRSQVRMIVDIALQSASGILSIEDVENQINCKRRVSTKLSPACGLYLTRVLY